MSVLQFPGRTAAQDAHPELDLLSASELLGFKKYYRWRLDCLFLLDATDQPWFTTIDLQEYHTRQMQAEMQFCIDSIAAINRRLESLGV